MKYSILAEVDTVTQRMIVHQTAEEAVVRGVARHCAILQTRNKIFNDFVKNQATDLGGIVSHGLDAERRSAFITRSSRLNFHNVRIKPIVMGIL